MNADGDDTAGPEIRLVHDEARRERDIAGASCPCFRIRWPWLLLFCQAESFLRWRSGGRGVPSDQATIEPIGALSKMVCADMDDLVSVA